MSNFLWQVSITYIGKGGITIKHSLEVRAAVREALKDKPRHFDTQAEAVRFHAKLPANVQAVTSVYPFQYI